ncbi:MAG: GNAT family N-acetyltransferase [Chloroflexi bacterium]|nr:GNAT family N-acetyltransferase [Chloroflexota bacterium]
MLHLQRYPNVQSFHQAATSFLERWEAEHVLLLGLCSSLAEAPLNGDQPTPYYFATVSGPSDVQLAALMTPPQRLVLSRVLDPDALPLLAEDLLSTQWPVPGVLGPKAHAQGFAALWKRLTGEPFHLHMAERIYQLEQVVPVTTVPGFSRRAAVGDRPLLIDWFIQLQLQREAEGASGEAAQQEAGAAVDRRLMSRAGGLYLWIDERPVSLAGYAGPTPNGIRIGPVFTPPQFRRRGYASAVTAALSQILLDAGYRFCSLFTDLANPTSNKIYQQIGYRPVCDVDVYRFSAPRS